MRAVRRHGRRQRVFGDVQSVHADAGASPNHPTQILALPALVKRLSDDPRARRPVHRHPQQHRDRLPLTRRVLVRPIQRIAIHRHPRRRDRFSQFRRPRLVRLVLVLRLQIRDRRPLPRVRVRLDRRRALEALLRHQIQILRKRSQRTDRHRLHASIRLRLRVRHVRPVRPLLAALVPRADVAALRHLSNDRASAPRDRSHAPHERRHVNRRDVRVVVVAHRVVARRRRRARALHPSVAVRARASRRARDGAREGRRAERARGRRGRRDAHRALEPRRAATRARR